MYSKEQCVEANNTEGSVKFEKLCSKLTSLTYGRSEGDKQYINALLDEFNSLDFKKPIVWNQHKAVLAVNQCCTIVPPNYTFLVAKCCQLIDKIVTQQQVKVEGKTFVVAVNWCLQSLVYCADVAVLDILAALSALLRGNGHVMEQFNEVFSKNSNLMRLADPDLEAPFLDLKLASLWDIRLSALSCFQAVTSVSSDVKDNAFCGLALNQLEICSELFFKVLSFDRAAEQDEFNYIKMMVICLQGLQNVFSQSQPLLEKMVGDTIGCVKAFMLFGLPGHAGLKPQRVFPSPLAQADVKPVASKGVKNTKVKLRNRKYSKKSEGGGSDNWKEHSIDSMASSEGLDTSMALALYPAWLKTSESDYSDTEAGQATKFRVFQGRVRQAALSLLQTLVKLVDKKLLFGYLSSLLPDGAKTPQTRTLMTCLLRDPSPRCRMEVLNVLATLLSGSKMFFLQAEYREKTSASFTPYSVTLGNILRELHQSLRLALSAENSVPVIVQLLKVLVRLVQNSPYHRLNGGLISKIVRSVRPFLRHKDGTVQVASLSVMRSIISTDPSIPEIAEILNRPYMVKNTNEATMLPPDEVGSEASVMVEGGANSDFDSDSIYDDCESEDEEVVPESVTTTDLTVSWLLETCLEKLGVNCRQSVNASVSIAPVPVRVESLQVLALLARMFYSLLVAPHISYVMQVIEAGLMDVDPAIPLHSGRLIEALTYSIQQSLKEVSEKGHFSQMKTVTALWKMMIDGPITFLIQNPGDPTLRYTGCDCLANMSAEVFEQLPREKQIFIVTLLFGSSADEKGSVRASAIRALSAYVLFPSQREDIHFVMDTAECILKSLHESNIITRVRVSWSLSNLSEALLMNVNDCEEEKIPNSLFSQLLESSIKASNDSEKVRFNSVRAIGNFLRILDDERLSDDSIKNSVQEAFNTLVKNASTGNVTKLRWNACYALGNAMRNHVLYSNNRNWQAAVFLTLSDLVQNYRNFKVRISAASALSSPSTRQQYGNHYLSLWTVLMNALDNSQNMEDFTEYQHRDNLLDQICLTLIHLASLVSDGDLVFLQDNLVFHADTLQQHLLRFQQRVVPEKTAALVEAAAHVSSLLQLSPLTADQHSAASLLTSIFVLDSDISLF